MYVRSPSDLRDIDLVLVGGDSEELETISDLLSKNSVDADIELIDSADQYFNSRDISINEALLRPDSLHFSDKAKRDALRQQAVPTQYEFKKYMDVSPKVALRNVLIAIRERVNYRLSPDIIRAISRANSFLLLLHLATFLK